MSHFQLLFCIFVVISGVHGFYMNTNKCDIYPQYANPGIPKDPNNVIEDRVPADCITGKVEWHYPRGHLMLHFPNRARVHTSICLIDIFGNSGWGVTSLGVKDVTDGSERPLGDATLGHLICTTKSNSTDIVLKLTGLETNVYLGGFRYRIRRRE